MIHVGIFAATGIATLNILLNQGLFLYVLIRILSATDSPKIKNLPEARGWPIVGNLLQLGNDHATVLQRWSKHIGPVFQIRLGTKRVVIANSYKTVKELWIDNQSALISRPQLYTFHSVVSTSQGFTIGTSPWDISCKNRRKAAATALNRPAVQSYMPIIDLESYEAIRDLYRDSNNGKTEINPKPYFQRYALNTSLTLNYGTRMKSVKDDMLNEIIQVEAAISRFRSTSNNWQDYLPILRIFPQKNSSAVEFRKRRDAYLNHLLQGLKSDINKGIDKPCITGNILKDPTAKLNAEEVNSICLTMVSAGLDTVPANLIQGVGYLSSPHGQEIQEHAYQAIMKAYPDGDAWEKCLLEEKIPYLTALVKEVLRFYTVIPMCLPRQSIKDITFEGSVIPAGTLFYMNAQAADMDPERYPEPEKFNPSRYLDEKLQEGVSAIPHFAYGAGSRMCAGSHLGNRELFTAFTRLVSAFKILPEESFDPDILNAVTCNMCPTALVAEPKDFKVRLVPRDEMALEEWLERSRIQCQE